MNMNYDTHTHTHTHTHNRKGVAVAGRTIMEVRGFVGGALEGTGQN